ncbi:hypothetical protein LZ31DRAFT_559549 [Colletotrichum somersetense]|nr:hypothetical protein LZ31DRAFT_559549 [Colletotrichum somersetense]
MSVQIVICGVHYWLQQPSISWTEASRRRSHLHLLIVTIVFTMAFAGADVGFAASFGKVQDGAFSTAACLVAVLAVYVTDNQYHLPPSIPISRAPLAYDAYVGLP